MPKRCPVLVSSLVLLATVATAAALPPMAPTPVALLWGRTPVEDGLTVVHRYDDAVLVALDGDPPGPPPAGSRRLADPDLAGFGGWRGPVPPATAPAAVTAGDWLVLTLAGPADPAWLAALEDAGLEILAPAHPYAVVATARDGALARCLELTTSAGFRVVRGVAPLPPRARVARSLWPILDAHAPVAGPVELLLRSTSTAPDVPTVVAEGAGRELAALLRSRPELAFVARPLRPEPHLDLALQGPLTGIAPVAAALGLDGAGIVVDHNDTGVDLRHPDLPPAAVLATNGRMAYTDNAHGTHTASIVVGRGGAPAPAEGGGCDPLYPPVAEIRGVAPAARLVTNNLFDGGAGDIPGMMAWAARHGATVSNNSWGLFGSGTDAFAYSPEAAAVDAAVRDADPANPVAEPLTVVFAAGNVGPGESTVTAPGTAKNAITVGATQNARCGFFVPGTDPGPDPDRVLSISSRGPAQGRLKPDLVAPGGEIVAAGSGDLYAAQPWDQDWTGPRYDLATGTSQAAAVVSGAATLLHQWFRQQHGLAPSPALVKAALVAGATDLGLAQTVQGWGRLDLERAILGPDGGHATLLDAASFPALASGTTWQHELMVASAAAPLTVVLVWSDVPGEPGADHPLVNDLDLELVAPDGTRYRGNRLDGAWSTPDPDATGDDANPLEVVRVAAPTPGSWQLAVRGVSVPRPPADLTGQDFVLAIAGDAAPCAAPLPPDGVSAAAVGPNRIELRWTPVPGAASYLVRRVDWPGDGPFVPLARVAAPAASYLDTAVDGGLEYRYLVEAELDAVCSSVPSESAAATATGSCTAPPVFAGLAEVAPAGTASCGLVLRWPAATAPCGGPVVYDVYRDQDDGPVVAPGNLVAAGVAALGWVDGDLGDGETARYVVRARDLAAGSGDANLVERLATVAGPDRLWLDADPDRDPTAMTALPASAADQDGQPWTVTDEQRDSGSSAWGCRTEVTVKDQALQTARPLALPAGHGIVLELRHLTALDPGHDGGRLEYSTDGGASWHDILDGDGAAVAADPGRILSGGYDDILAGDNPLAGEPAWSGHSHGWRALRVALDDFARRPLLLRLRLATAGRAGGGGWWVDGLRIAAATACLRCTPPPPPEGVTAVATGDGVELSWSPAATDAAHVVERATDGPLLPTASTAAGVDTYLDRTTSGGTSYRYAVRSAVDGCRSEPSPATAVTASGPCRLAPVFYGLATAANPPAAGCAIHLAWPPATAACAGDPIRYHVYRSTAPTVEPGLNATLLATVTSTSFDDLRVVSGRTYSYLVRALHRTAGIEDANLRARSLSPRGLFEVPFSDGAETGLGPWHTGPGSAADSGTEPWGIRQDDARSGAAALMVAGESRVKDQVLELARPFALAAGTAPVLEFWHRYDNELFWDGGRLEYTTDGGASWHDILAGDGSGVDANPRRFLRGGYTGNLQYSSNPIATSRVWTGWTVDWDLVRVDLTDFAGRTISLRWRLGCDSDRSGEGWWVDDVRLAWPLPCRSEPPPPRTDSVRPGGG